MNIYQSSLMFASKARAYPNGTSYLANWLDVLGGAAQETEESISYLSYFCYCEHFYQL